MDKDYWSNYYAHHGTDKGISTRSSFAQLCSDQFLVGKIFSIVDLGAGNCRDAAHFAQLKHTVYALDQSPSIADVGKESVDIEFRQYLRTEAVDFVSKDYSKLGKIDAFYSRFTIHSITKEDEITLLPKIYRKLNNGGLLCIEVRTTKDPLYGIGERCGINTFMTDGHKRRFIDSREFREEVSNIGFKELYFIEQDNLSVYKDDNPVLMRIILQK
jgi:SAM-dependent methyltransferase